MRITAKLLREKGACKSNVIDFEEQWPDGCEITPENCEIAFGKLDMSVDWAATHFLPTKAQIKYRKTTNPAWCEYRKATSSLETHAKRKAAFTKFKKIAAATFCELAQQST